jgi:hypothetical protein
VDDGQAGNDGDAEPGGDEGLDGDVVIGSEVRLWCEPRPPARVGGDPIPGAGRCPSDPGLTAQFGELECPAPPGEAVPRG